jgi:oxygen-dependent protoporphyrinogen oxidase
MPRIVIVGGGISGLTLAFRLEALRPDLDVVVLERATRAGGVVDTAARDGFRVEAGPNGFLDHNPALLDLCRELGLQDRLVAASEAAGKNRFLLLGGRLRKLPTSLWSFVTSDVVGAGAKLALLTERFQTPRRDDGDESIDSFVRRRAGREAAETLADAFVTGIWAGDPAKLSVRAAFPRLAAMERDHGSVTRGFAAARRQRNAAAAAKGETPKPAARMWSFREGLHLLIEALSARLRRPAATGAAARSFRPAGSGGWLLRCEGTDVLESDVLVLTCPAYEQAGLLDDVDAELAKQIAEISYNRVAVVAVGFRAADVPVPVDGFGYLSRHRDRRDVLGVQWCSSIYPDRAPPGYVLLRALCGGVGRPEVVDWDDQRLLTAVRLELGQSLRVMAPPVFHHIVRWDKAIPQYNLGHLERVAWIDDRLAARHPRLFLGGNAYRGVALHDCVEQAGRLAERVAAAF